MTIEERNTADICIMTFNEYLNSLLDTHQISKNNLIRTTGIDRSSFFQFLKGTRKPTGRQLLKIGYDAGFKDEEKALLHELYVREKYGEEVFRTWETLRKMTEQLDTLPPVQPGDDAVERYLMKTVTDSSGQDKVHFDLFLPVSTCIQSDIFGHLALLPGIFSGTVSVRIIVVNIADPGVHINELVELYMRSVLLYTVPRLDLSLYHFQGNYQRHEIPLIGFPFFILSSRSIMMLNDLSSDCKVLEDTEFLEKYTQSFEEFLKKCQLLSRKMPDVLNFTEYLSSFLPESDDELLYTLEYRPCVYSVATKEMVDKYAPPGLREIAWPYVHMCQSVLHMKQYFHPEGLRAFREDRMIYEAGMNLLLEEEDVNTVCSLLLGKAGDTISFVDPRRFRMSEKWHIAARRNALLFSSYGDQNIVVLSLNPQLCNAFYQYFSHLDEDGSELPVEALPLYTS